MRDLWSRKIIASGSRWIFFLPETPLRNCMSLARSAAAQQGETAEPKLLILVAEYRMNAKGKTRQRDTRPDWKGTEWNGDNYRHFRVVLQRVAFRIPSYCLSLFPSSVPFSFFPFIASFARAFIKINFDADLLTVDLPTSKLNLGMDSNSPSESR